MSIKLSYFFVLEKNMYVNLGPKYNTMRNLEEIFSLPA